MLFSNHGRFSEQVRFLRRQFLQDGDLPFTNVLSENAVTQALTAVDVVWKDRIYSPLVTLWIFLGQILSPDHSCRSAVARLIAHRLSSGQSSCSAKTGAYCQARTRLPEELFSTLARQTGRVLDANAHTEWLWKRRRVYAYDGTTVTMPDTPENQQAYPQPANQRPGLGFPMARLAAVFSLSCGAVLELGICRYAGKGQSELGMLRTLMNTFRHGDVLLGDRFLCAWTEMVMLQQRGVDCVSRLRINRRADFRRGRRLGKGDHIVTWPKPRKPRSIDRVTYKALPESLTIRECLIRVAQPGFRSKVIVLATTLLDADQFSKEDLAELYRARWNAELDFRSLKTALQLDTLRCKTPELVRKEIWTHILAYNLIRTIMAQAATRHGIQPRSISFKGTLQTLEAFQPMLAIQCQTNSEFRMHIYHQLLKAVAIHRVADRPDRFEPRRRKLTHRKYEYLNMPRHELKLLMCKGFKEI
jgi:hypothetical protein